MSFITYIGWGRIEGETDSEVAMDPTSLIGPAVVAAVISGIISIFVASRRANVDQKLAEMRGAIERDLGTRRAVVDERLATLRSQFEKELAEQRAQLDHRAMYAAERVAHELLMHPAWEQRSFEAIQHRLGGFAEDELI
jgi:hypothetical protein